MHILVRHSSGTIKTKLVQKSISLIVKNKLPGNKYYEDFIKCANTMEIRYNYQNL